MIVANSHFDQTQEELRTLLLAEFAQILNVPVSDIDSSSSFDEYGLDSIEAILATGRLSELIGIELTPEFLILHRTFDEAFHMISELVERQKMKMVDTDTPVFILLGGGGRDGRISRLATHCRPQITTEILSFGNWQDWFKADLGLEYVIQRCCDQINTRLPEGPVRMAGYSQGGQVAYAVALALKAKGREVDTLMLFDCSIEATQSRITLRERARCARAASKFVLKGLKHFVSRGLNGLALVKIPTSGGIGESPLLMLADCARSLDSKIVRKMVVWISERRPHLSMRDGVALDNLLQMQFLDFMWRDWLKGPLKVVDDTTRTFLFRSKRDGADDLGWRTVCSRLDIVLTEGDHFTMFNDSNLDDLASKFYKSAKWNTM